MIKDFLPVKGIEQTANDIEFVESFWSRQLKGNMDSAFDCDLSRREEFHQMAPILDTLPSDARILDGGCGCGEWTVFLSRKGFQTTGLDISNELITRLTGLFPKNNFVRGDLRNTGFATGMFDLFFSWGAIEHFEDGPGSCLAEAYRTLKPGGYLMVSVPFANRRQLKRRAHATSGQPASSAESVRFYQWRFTREELGNELRQQGFVVTGLYPIHKEEGLRRLLALDRLGLPSGSILHTLALRVGSMLVRANDVSHMLLAVGRKPCDVTK